jgi:hypothetical protein
MFTQYELMNNKFHMNLKQTHEACKFVMLVYLVGRLGSSK